MPAPRSDSLMAVLQPLPICTKPLRNAKLRRVLILPSELHHGNSTLIPRHPEATKKAHLTSTERTVRSAFRYLITVRGGTMRELGRFAQCPRRILSIASRMVPEHRRCSGAGIGDRDGLGIDHSARDTEDRATRLEVRRSARTVAAVSRRYGNYTSPRYWKISLRAQIIEYLCSDLIE